MKYSGGAPALLNGSDYSCRQQAKGTCPDERLCLYRAVSRYWPSLAEGPVSVSTPSARL